MALTRFEIQLEGMTITGEGIVDVQGAPAADPSAAIVEFLDALDPQAIEQEALNRMGWGDGDNTTKAIIDVMRMLATGEVRSL